MKRTILAGALAACSLLTAEAGGLLTNTNQNVAFLRNPSRDAVIGIDGVYSNPAGVLFLGDGLYLSVNIQSPRQLRIVESDFGGFKYGVNNGGQSFKRFEGEAIAPVVPSIQAAYNKGKWSFQANFAVMGGGGKCEFNNGLGSFESVVSLIPMMASKFGLDITGYDYESYLKGRQYYFGLQLGAAREILPNLSGYFGMRFMYGTCNYHGYLRNIQVRTSGGQMSNAHDYFGNLYQQALQGSALAAEAAEKYLAAGLTTEAQKYQAMAQEYAASARTAGALAQATTDVTLNCDQTGFGVAPAIGLDYQLGPVNFAVKYDFRVKMNLKNVSANSESADNLSALKKYKDGGRVREDQPALLAAGVQWTVIEPLRLTAGYHHFFDTKAKMYDNAQDKLDGGTNEYMFGVEYDINKTWTVSGGVQSTNYQFTDDFMNDISFNVSSYTLGGGLAINITDRVKLNLAYFQTNYQTYDKQTSNYGNLGGMVEAMAGHDAAGALMGSGALKGTDSFTRTNKVFGIGVDFKF